MVLGIKSKRELLFTETIVPLNPNQEIERLLCFEIS